MKNIKSLLFTSCVLFSPLVVSSQVFATDVIVQGSICIGFDCVTSESFGFDTQRLKENNLRIHFDDTSNSASFPANDWRITINDTDNGGANYFGIEDATAGRMPFRVEAGAPNNNLVVESDGDVGIKTINPVVDLHIVEGNTPTVRLEQDGSDGFTPQTWDLAGNEANFFVRDVNTGRLPFRIQPGATDNSIYVNSNGNVSINSSSNVEQLYVNGSISSEGAYRFRRANTDFFRIHYDVAESTLNVQDLQSNNNVIVIEEDSPNNALYFHDTGNLSIGSEIQNRKLYINGGLTVNGDIYCLSDRKIKSNVSNLTYGLPEIMKLSAKQYTFNSKEYASLNLAEGVQLGLIAQEVQSIIPEVVTNDINFKDNNNEMSTLKGVNYTALIPVLVKAIQEQQELIVTKNKELDEVKTQLADLNDKVNLLLSQKGMNDDSSPTQIIDGDNEELMEVQNTDKNSSPNTSESLNNGRSKSDINKQEKKGN